MRKIAIKVLAVMTAVAILPLQTFSVGDGLHSEPAAVPLTAVKQEFAAQAQAQAQETFDDFKIMKERPESFTPPLTHTEATGEAHSAEEVLPQTKTAGIFDKDPVTLLEFGGDFLAGYLRGLNNLTSRLADTGGNLPEFVFDYQDNAGRPHSIYMGIYYDETNQLLIGRDQQGAFGFGFDFDLQKRMMYSSFNGFERQMGFTRLYDTLAPAAGIFYQTRRIEFEYAGQDWMIQIWKGIYFFAGTGAEIGIYNKPTSRTLAFYDCAGDDELLEMSMRLSRNEKVLFERQAQKHWWMNGVVLSDALYPPAALTLEGGIRFEDEGMKAAFLVPFEQLCEQEGIAYNIEGGLVEFIW